MKLGMLNNVYTITLPVQTGSKEDDALEENSLLKEFIRGLKIEDNSKE